MEIKHWVKRNISKKHEAIEVSPESFGPRFCEWWKASQPNWRILPDGSYCRDVPDTETWSTLQKGGTAGFFVVIMALSWWVRGIHQLNNESVIWKIMDDLRWVLQQIREKKILGKRLNAGTDDGEGIRAKRFVFALIPDE